MGIFNRNVNYFEEAFVRDVRNMCNIPGADDNTNEPINAQDDEIMKMKVPLSFVYNNEIRDLARYLIARERNMKKPNFINKRIKYGEAS